MRGELPLDGDAELGQRHDGERLALGFEDLGQLHVARLVQSQIRRDDGRQIDLERLEAGVDLARHGGHVAGARELGCERGLRPTPQRRQHLTRLAVVVVDCLFAEHDEPRLLA